MFREGERVLDEGERGRGKIVFREEKRLLGEGERVLGGGEMKFGEG